MVIFNEFSKPQGKYLLDSAINKLRTNHPNLNVNVNYVRSIYPTGRTQMFKAISNGGSFEPKLYGGL
jgi:hypothetical protein